MGGHCIDLLEMFFGPVEPRELLHRQHGARVQERRQRRGAAASSQSGALGTVDTFFCIPDEGSKNALELYGSLGSILAEGTIGQGAQGKMTAFLKAGRGRLRRRSRRATPRGGIDIAPEPVNMYRAEIEEFSRAVLEGGEPRGGRGSGRAQPEGADGLLRIGPHRARDRGLREERAMQIDLTTTIKGSLLEGFFPAGWDLARIDACAANPPETVLERQPWWHPEFEPVPCDTLADFDTMMGHEIALQIRRTREAGRKLALILPVGPMGMYRWAVYFLKEWGVSCDHVHGFNMDEWSDGEGNTLPPDNPGAFQYAMEQAFYGPLGELTVPASAAPLRHARTAAHLRRTASRALKAEGARAGQ